MAAISTWTEKLNKLFSSSKPLLAEKAVLERFGLAEIFIFTCFSYTVVFFGVSVVCTQQCTVFLIADSHFSVIAFVKLLCFLLMLLEKYCYTRNTPGLIGHFCKRHLKQ